ncbi:MAG: hypothetical protein JXB00_10890 [Bacteroidales bacterium]|nr:hypothetical protein [Bacteroidales bacterium]
MESKHWKLFTILIVNLITINTIKGQWLTNGTNIYNTNTGNVGIGETSPDSWFSPAKTLQITHYRPVLKLKSLGMTNTITFTNNAVNSGTHAGEFHLNHYYNSTDVTKSYLNFYGYPGGNALTILANSNIGIGTTDPTQKLEVTGNILTEIHDNMTNYLASGYNNVATDRPTFQTLRARGTKTSKLAVQQNDALGAFFFGGFSGTTYQYGSALYSYVDGPVTSTSVPARISFVTGSNSTDRQDRLTIKANGNIGIGTTSPNSRLEVAGTIHSTSGGFKLPDGTVLNSGSQLGGGGGTSFWTTIGTDGIRYDGKVGIGIDAGASFLPGDYQLAVNGKIIATEIKVQTDIWADFVFEKDYNLWKLCEVEKYIQENKHLPGMPTSGEVAQEGVSLGEMNALLLKKIEELTLYLIQQQKRIEELEKRIDKSELHD